MLHHFVRYFEAKANFFFANDQKMAAKSMFMDAAKFQENLFNSSPYKASGRRFLNAQWCWAMGHIGIIGQLIKYNLMLPKHEQFRIIIETEGREANEHYLRSMEEHVLIYEKLPEELKEEAMHNAILFSCPFGQELLPWCKQVERKWEKFENKQTICRLTEEQKEEAHRLFKHFNLNYPVTAIHHRNSLHDPKRNISILQIFKDKWFLKDRNILVGIDQHGTAIPTHKSVNRLPESERKEASFLLTATCDKFIGADSGMWTIAHHFGKPVEIVNDYEKNAWIYELG